MKHLTNCIKCKKEFDKTGTNWVVCPSCRPSKKTNYGQITVNALKRMK